MKKSIKTIIAISVMALGLGGAFIASTANGGMNKVEEVKAAYANKDITDPDFEIRFTRPNDNGWGGRDVYIHTWNEGGSGTSWPGVPMTYLWDNSYRQPVYSWSPSSGGQHLYGNIIINAGNGGPQTDTLETPSSSKWFYYDGSAGIQPAAHELELETIYLYDYDDAFDGDVYVHLWRDDGKKGSVFENGWPGKKATRVISVGHIYEYTFSNRYDRVIFSKNGASKTGDLTFTNNYAYVRADESTELAGKGTWWDNINYVYAHDLAQNTLMLRNDSKGVPTTDQGETQYCSARFGSAETYINALDDLGIWKDWVLPQLTSNFANATPRLEAWAKANNKTFDPSTGKITPNQVLRILYAPVGGKEDDGSSLLTIVAVIVLSAVAVIGYFLLRKKRI